MQQQPTGGIDIPIEGPPSTHERSSKVEGEELKLREEGQSQKERGAGSGAAGAKLSTQQGSQYDIGHGGLHQQQQQTGGIDEGIKIMPVQREVSGLLPEGKGEPDTKDARGALLMHQERVPLTHDSDDATRKVDAVDYVDPKESEGYKERQEAAKLGGRLP
jgi:hypothetical protein